MNCTFSGWHYASYREAHNCAFFHIYIHIPLAQIFFFSILQCWSFLVFDTLAKLIIVSESIYTHISDQIFFHINKSIIKCTAHSSVRWEDDHSHSPLGYPVRAAAIYFWLQPTYCADASDSGPSPFILIWLVSNTEKARGMNWERNISITEVGELGVPLGQFTRKWLLSYFGLFFPCLPSLVFGRSVIPAHNTFHESKGHLVPHGQSLSGPNNNCTSRNDFSNGEIFFSMKDMILLYKYRSLHNEI